MQNDMTLVYSGVTIDYHEYDNTWHFELRGRERSVGSLKEAKEAIDKPEPRAKDKFDRVKAYFLGTTYRVGKGQKYAVVEVTSVAAEGFGSDPHFWIVSDGNRSKESSRQLVPVTEDTTVQIEMLQAMESEIDKLHKQIEAIERKLPRVKA